MFKFNQRKQAKLQWSQDPIKVTENKTSNIKREAVDITGRRKENIKNLLMSLDRTVRI